MAVSPTLCQARNGTVEAVDVGFQAPGATRPATHHKRRATLRAPQELHGHIHRISIAQAAHCAVQGHAVGEAPGDAALEELERSFLKRF